MNDLPEEHIPAALRGEHRQYRERELMYGIGIQHGPHEFGMLHGPWPNLKMALETVGGDERAAIIRFNPNMSEEILYVWRKDRWVRDDKAQEAPPRSPRHYRGDKRLRSNE